MKKLQLKTIFITSFHILVGRNLLFTDTLKILAAKGVRIIILVPNYKKGYFEKSLRQEGVVIEGVAAYGFSKKFAGLFFKRLARPILRTHTSNIRTRQKLFLEKKVFYYFFFLLPARFLGRFALIIRLARWLDFSLAPDKNFFKGLFERYRPDLVIAADINNENDVALLQDAKRNHIPTLGWVRSWDGPTNFLVRAVPDRIAVWNDTLKSELITFQQIKPGAISVVGIPHYDRYLRGPTLSREDFFRKLGADLSKKLILYVPVKTR